MVDHPSSLQSPSVSSQACFSSYSDDDPMMMMMMMMMMMWRCLESVQHDHEHGGLVVGNALSLVR